MLKSAFVFSAANGMYVSHALTSTVVCCALLCCVKLCCAMFFSKLCYVLSSNALLGCDALDQKELSFTLHYSSFAWL